MWHPTKGFVRNGCGVCLRKTGWKYRGKEIAKPHQHAICWICNMLWAFEAKDNRFVTSEHYSYIINYSRSLTKKKEKKDLQKRRNCYLIKCTGSRDFNWRNTVSIVLKSSHTKGISDGMPEQNFLLYLVSRSEWTNENSLENKELGTSF